MDNQFIHVLKILHFPVCVTFLKNILSFQSCHVCYMVPVNVPVFLFLMQKWMMSIMWTLHSFDFISTKIRALFICTNIYYLSKTKMSFVHEYRNYQENEIYDTELSRTEILQNFGFSLKILHSRNWKSGFSFATCLNLWKKSLCR